MLKYIAKWTVRRLTLQNLLNPTAELTSEPESPWCVKQVMQGSHVNCSNNTAISNCRCQWYTTLLLTHFLQARRCSSIGLTRQVSDMSYQTCLRLRPASKGFLYAPLHSSSATLVLSWCDSECKSLWAATGLNQTLELGLSLRPTRESHHLALMAFACEDGICLWGWILKAAAYLACQVDEDTEAVWLPASPQPQPCVALLIQKHSHWQWMHCCLAKSWWHFQQQPPLPARHVSDVKCFRACRLTSKLHSAVNQLCNRWRYICARLFWH